MKVRGGRCTLPVLHVFAPNRGKFPSWKRARSLYLLTRLPFGREPPIHSPDLEDPIPLYLLPLSPSERQGIGFWAASYRLHHERWLLSGDLEARAYRQLADPRSELSTAGRESCSSIESATGKPTYYYLMRYYGRKSGEEGRLCPLCGGRWAVRGEDDTASRFSPFGFRCERCRLVFPAGASVSP